MTSLFFPVQVNIRFFSFLCLYRTVLVLMRKMK